MQIQTGDDVTHNGYPIGTLVTTRQCIGNGQAFGIVKLHCHDDAELVQIPLHELRADVRNTEAAL